MRVAPAVTVTADQRTRLETWSRGHSTPHKLVMRARIILQAADGKQNKEIAEALNLHARTVGSMRRRFIESGISGIEKDKTRSGRKPKLSASKEKEIVEATLHTKPKNATHWSVRTLAKEMGASHMTVHRVWRKYNIKPHLVKTFKLSNDPQFVEKLRDIVGLYVSPPDHAIVLSVDEKSQIQALDRTQRTLPLRSGNPETQTHDYKRNGTTTLFAALNILDGEVIADCKKRHRHQEWLGFLKQIDKTVDPSLDVHLIADNYATHKHPKVKRWLAKHPRFHMHFTPTSSSWLNLVERFFGELTDKRIRRGAFKSVPELIAAIMQYIDAHNEDPAPFVWKASTERIIEKIRKARAALEQQALVTPH